jgi:hypothetical protein
MEEIAQKAVFPLGGAPEIYLETVKAAPKDCFARKFLIMV